MSQSSHDDVVTAVQLKYAGSGITASVNTEDERNPYKGLYPDVFVPGKYVVEVETADTVSAAEADCQWVKYAETFKDGWHLVVPLDKLQDAKKLLAERGIENCTVSSWWDPNPTQNLSNIQFTPGIPGL